MGLFNGFKNPYAKGGKSKWSDAVVKVLAGAGDSFMEEKFAGAGNFTNVDWYRVGLLGVGLLGKSMTVPFLSDRLADGLESAGFVLLGKTAYKAAAPMVNKAVKGISWLPKSVQNTAVGAAPTYAAIGGGAHRGMATASRPVAARIGFRPRAL